VSQTDHNAGAAVEDYLDTREHHSPALFIGLQPANKATSSNRLTIPGAQHDCRQLA
jgi:hypothetical protein